MAAPTVTSTQATTVIAKPISGDYRIDVLLDDGSFRWNATQPLGTAVEVTYSFASVPGYATGSHANGFSSFTDSQKVAARQAFADIAAVSNLTFKEVADTGTAYGQIRLANNAQSAGSAGYALFPDPSNGETAGDVFINNVDPANLSNVVPGTNAYATVVHEILHGLGIKHPGNYNAGEPPAPVPGNYLAAAEDSEVNTIMSYIKAPQKQERDFLGSYDLLALQYFYGVRKVNTGTNTYALGDSAGQKLQLLYDSGGIDTLDVAAATAAATIDLGEGKSSSIGRLADGTAAITNVQIAFGTVIENAIGTQGNDSITGNAANNQIAGGGGNDTVDGGNGVDAAVYSGARAGYTLTHVGAGWTVADGTAGRDGTDTLANVERLKFSDEMVALDLAGNAGAVAKVLGAVFGASAVANKQFVGIGLSLMDGGMSYSDLVKLALDYKLGAGFGNEAEVRLLYQNVVGTPAGDSDVATFTGMITSGQLTQTSLGVLAADTSINTGNIKLTGLSGTGLEYTPVG